MAKRGAQREINHDNWDQEEEPEDAGVFKQATTDILKGREIKRAKRRGAAGEEAGGVANTPSLFKGFTGFTSTNTKPTGFSFNSDSSKSLGGLSNGGMAPFSFGSSGSGMNFGKTTTAPSASSSQEKKSESDKEAKTESGATNGSSPNKSKYLSQLRALNESVSKWISEHVNKNAYCILTPIFKDYERHLSQIELLNPAKKEDGGKATEAETKTSSSSEDKETKEEKKETESDKGTATFGASKPFSFGSGTGFSFPTGSTSTPSLFGKDTKSTTPGSGFSFGTDKASESKPFSFATSGSSSASAGAKQDEEEEYQPPKPEIQEIQEDGAFYTKRCKLYYQKDGQWVDRGVGNLHLKPCEEKTQLLVRADTNLGNILLNIMLSASIPVTRQGKNNVSLMCIPNPPIDPKQTSGKPTGMLIKVKTTEDADELYEKMNENKK